MRQITLVNMPFYNIALPSIALTQLKAVAEEKFGNEVRVRILYLNQEFMRFVGADLYDQMSSTLAANNSGLGDWLFRSLAFPEVEDNAQQYFQRYFPHGNEELQALKGRIVAKRTGLPRFMQRCIKRHRLDREDLVGFTSMFSQNVASFAMARLIKERNPKVLTVMGGANCESPMGQEIALHLDAVDFVVSGPALVSFPQFLATEVARG